MIYIEGIYSRDEIRSARPVIGTVGGYSFAKCLKVVIDNITNYAIAIDFHTLYAWNHYEEAGRYRRMR